MIDQPLSVTTLELLGDAAMASQDDDQIKLRLPPGVRAEIKEAAAAAGRSMNTEAVRRLQSYPNSESNDMAKGSTLTIRLSDEMRAKLDDMTKRGPYRISITSVVERGIELAAEELARLK